MQVVREEGHSYQVGDNVIVLEHKGEWETRIVKCMDRSK